MISTKKQKNEAYDYLIENNYKDLFRYAYKLTGCEATSEDILQDTLIRAWISIDSLKNHEKVKSWIITILRRENLRRIHKDKVNLTDNYVDFEYLLTDNSNLEDNMDKETIFQNINELKTHYREPLILQIFFGYSVEEIAHELKLNENTVSTRLFRGKSLLQKRMKQPLKTTKKHSWVF